MSDVQPHLAGVPTIVVVDDESGVRNGLRSLLEDAAYDVHCADNGRAALALVKSKSPALVITDLMMPEMSGSELAQAMKSDTALLGVPVILMTGAHLCDKSADRDLFAYVLQKPFSATLLLQKIAALLSEKRA